MLRKFYDFHAAKHKYYKRNQTIHTVLSFGLIIFWVFAFKSSVLDANNIPSGSMQPTLKIGDFLFVNKMRYSFRLPFTDIVLFRIDRPQRGDIVTFDSDSPSLQGKTLVKRVIGVPGDKVEVRDNEIYINGKKYGVTALTSREDKEVLVDMDCQRSSCLPSNLDFELFREKVTDPKSGRVQVDHYMLKSPTAMITSRNEVVFHPTCYPPADINQKIRTEEATLACPPWEDPIPDNHFVVMGDNRDNSQDSRFFGMITLDDIQGKVFMSYFSVNWQLRNDKSMKEETNPIKLLFQWVSGQRSGVFVRWQRVFSRIY